MKQKNLGRLALCFSLILPGLALAQAPVKIQDWGQYFVGGQLVSFSGADGKTYEEVINQSLVTYAIPEQLLHPNPIVLVPGLGLTNFFYTSTPDNRRGWVETLVREGHAVYVFDPVNYGTSPQPAAPFQMLAENNLPEGVSADQVPVPATWVFEDIWERWGMGPEENIIYPDNRLITTHIDEFYAAWATRWGLPAGAGARGEPAGPVPFPYEVIAGSDEDGFIQLLEQVGPAVVAGHSAGFNMVDAAARDRPELFAAVVALESVSCGPSWTDLEDMPFFSMFMDYAYIGRADGRLIRCANTAKATRDAGGTGDLLLMPNYPPVTEVITLEALATIREVATSAGVAGNNHIFTHDNNNDKTARAFSIWIKSRVGNTSPPTDAQMWKTIVTAVQD